VGSGGARPEGGKGYYWLCNRKRKGEVREGLGRGRRVDVPEPELRTLWDSR